MSNKSESQLSERQQGWLAHIRQQESSGLAATEYCKQHQISAAGLYNARHILRQKGMLSPADCEPKTSFVPVTVVDRSARSLPTCRLVTPSGLTLEFTDALTVPQIQSILAIQIARS